MTLSIWRYAHLALALVSSAFLIILSVTGVILAYDAIAEKTQAHRIENLENITLAQVLPILRDQYSEVLELKIDHNQLVSIDAMDENGNSIKAYIDPKTGKKLGEIKPKSDFIQWITALHRSLFLKESGRAIVAVVSFLLMLISVSGLILIIKRQKGIKHFFDKINKDFFAQYFHVVTGRWLLVPVFIIALTGTLVFLARLDYFKGENTEIKSKSASDTKVTALKDIPFFKETPLSKVERVEFPFIPDDEAEPFIIHLRKKSVTVNQVTGTIISETKYPFSAAVEKFNLDLHTGRTNAIWAFILGLASMNILFFIYSGFVITFRRTRTKIKNKIKAKDAEIVLLVGSENGTTLFFANQIHRQLLSEGKRSYLAEMNQFQSFESAKEMVIFTSTYGLGDPPSNANQFENLLQKFPQQNKIGYSVVGFGSKSYQEFCAFAVKVNDLLAKQNWAEATTSIFTVNDRLAEEFAAWAHVWSEQTLHSLATAPAVYNTKIPGLKKFIVTEKTMVSDENFTFKIVLKPRKNQKFSSGDLLAIYPANDNRERFYSIGKNQDSVQLIVKLFPNGFGSGFLNNLKVGDEIPARIMENPNFHFPQTAENIAMIANGTGIAPFLGMIQENILKKKISLYAGFRHDNDWVNVYRKFAENQIEKGQLENFDFAFSREENKQYVMDLIRKDENYFAELLAKNGTIMICGSLKMQKDVEIILDEICQKFLGKPLQHFIQNGQILSDCY